MEETYVKDNFSFTQIFNVKKEPVVTMGSIKQPSHPKSLIFSHPTSSPCVPLGHVVVGSGVISALILLGRIIFKYGWFL